MICLPTCRGTSHTCMCCHITEAEWEAWQPIRDSLDAALMAALETPLDIEP